MNIKTLISSKTNKKTPLPEAQLEFSSSCFLSNTVQSAERHYQQNINNKQIKITVTN